MANFDDQYYYNLAYARRQQQETNEVTEASRAIKPPSFFLYISLYGLSIIGDILDFANLTGVGVVVSIVVDLFIGTILFFAGRAAKNRVDTMNRFQNDLHDKIQNIENKIVTYRKAYAGALKLARKVKFLRKPTRVIALRFAKLRRSIARNPSARTIAAIGADLIPILDLLPWRTINIYFMRRDEMRAYKEAKEMLPEYLAAKADEIEAANDLLEIEAQEAAAVE